MFDINDPMFVAVLHQHKIAWDEAGNNTTLKQNAAGAAAAAVRATAQKEGLQYPATKDIKGVSKGWKSLKAC
jgi:hypothetical protein